MYNGFAIPFDDRTVSCVHLATVLSFVDFIPFFYIFGRSPPHLNKSPSPSTSQTWFQLFATCSYQQNQSESTIIVCSNVYDLWPVVFFIIAFTLAVFLLLFNLATVNRNLTYTTRIFRTIVHAVYALELFTTALIYNLNRYWCYDCKELISMCLIPILTTLFMLCNWYECNGEEARLHRRRLANERLQSRHLENERLQSRHLENERLHFTNRSSPRLVANDVIWVRAEAAVPSPPVLPSKTNPDPELENQYNNWLEAHRNNNNTQ